MAVRFGSFSEMPANFGGFLFCGVLWGFSFIIPGMTSSSILMAVGLLTPMVDGITHLDLSVLLPWTIGMCGVVALFARLVSKLFDAHYPLAYHAVIGVVLASTLAIIPTGFASSGEMIWSAVCAVLGAVLAALGGKIRPQEETSES
jgi:putative membrane protein